MQEDEQRPGPNDIDNSGDSTAEGDAGGVQPVPHEVDPQETVDPEPEVPTPVPVTVKSPASSVEAGERKPIAAPGHYILPLVISGVVATIMTVAFIAGVETIFPLPASERAAAAPAPMPSTADTPAASDPKPAASDPKPAASEPKPATSDPKPATSDTKPAASDPKPAAEKRAPADGTSSLGGALPLGGLLASLVPVAAADTPAHSESDSRPGPFGRFVILIKFSVLVLLGVGCGMVALGGLALSLDRPLGSLSTAICQMLACCCLSTLALLVPAPAEWLLGPIHYVVVALIFWASTIIFFRLAPRSAGMLLGGTMALLAVTAIGSQIVVWATWS